MKIINGWFWGMVVLAVAMLGVLMLLPGCASVESGNDAVVVRSEQARDVAVTTFDVLLELEYQNSELLWKVSPEIKRTCDYIRKNERLWINGLTSMINAYKNNRTAEGKANLTTALATLESGLQLAQKILSQAQEGMKLSPAQAKKISQVLPKKLAWSERVVVEGVHVVPVEMP